MARESVAFASAEEKDWIFGRTAKALYPALGK